MDGSTRIRVTIIALCVLAALLAPHAPRAETGAALGDEGQAPISAKERAARANVPEGLWILISIGEKSLTLYEGTEVKKRYAVATGTGDTPTPIGVFKVNSRFSGDLGGFGTRFLGLNVPWGHYGIHGTNKPQSIGSNASHGCVRMFVRDSEELYGMVPNGTKVVIEGGAYGLLDSYLRTLAAGDRNSHVAAVQRRMNVLGLYDGSADGVFGSGTMRAIKNARKSLGLPSGDKADAAFYKAIGIILFE